MADQNAPSPVNPYMIPEQAQAQGLPGAFKMLEDWWSAKPSERDRYKQPILDSKGNPVIGPDGKPMAAEVQNSPIDPQYGYRLKESPPISGWELGHNVAYNLHPFEVARDAVKGLKDIPQGVQFLDSLKRGAFSGGMTPEEYRDTFWATGGAPMTGNPEADAVSMAFSKPMDLKESEALRQQDIDNYKKALSLYGVLNPKTNELSFDWNGFARDLTLHPVEVGSLFVGGGAGFTKAAEGIAKLSGLENGLTIAQNLSRLQNVSFRPFSGTSSAMQAARDFGTIAADTVKAAAATPLAQGFGEFLGGTGRALTITGKVLDPISPLVGKATAKTATGAIDLARRISPYKASIYTPEFRNVWGSFQKEAEAGMIQQGMTPEMIKSPDTQMQLWYQFNTQTGNRFFNPFTDKANRAFDDLEAKAQGFSRYDYAPPHIGGVIDQTVKAKGKGITSPIIAEGAIRSAAPEGAGLTPRTPGAPKPTPIGVTRSAATGEAPGFLQQNESNIPFFGGRDLERSSRAATQTQLGEHLSENLGGRGATPVTHQDIADDFIQTQIGRRNAYRQAYEQSAAAEGNGVFTDPEAFANTYRNEYENALRSRNPNASVDDVNRLSQAAGDNFNRTTNNILEIGQYGAPFEVSIPGLPGTYTYNRATGSWVAPKGGVPLNRDIVDHLNTTHASQINAAPGNNMLSLRTLEGERKRLLDAAQNAYRNGQIDDYNALNVQIDALDNTAIKMAPTHNGSNVGQAIDLLRDARQGFREWRQTGIDAPNTSAYAPIKKAAQKVEQLTEVDPATGRYVFSNAPGARNDVGDLFRNQIVGENGIMPNIERPTEFISALTDPRSRLLSNPGIVQDYIRTGYGRPGVSPQDLSTYHSTYGGMDVLNPAEENFVRRNLAAQYATDPNAIPQRHPWQLLTDLEKNMSLTDRAKAWAKNAGRGLSGYVVGSALDAPIASTFGFDPNLRWLAGGSSALSNPAGRIREAIGPIRGLQSGAPSYSVNLNPSLATAPLRTSGVASGYGDTAEYEKQRALVPDQGTSAQDMQDEEAQAERMFSQLNAEQKPEGQYRGGRTAYKAGGKVAARDIEPLVRNLINKAKQAKKVSDKATEPLLNAHDDAIATALATAQKAI